MNVKLNDKAVTELRAECETNPASSAVFHVWAMRKRTRNMVNINSLYQRMRKEGFNYSKDEYRAVLKLLGDLGFGTVLFNKYAKVKSLVNIKAPLQAIGAAACDRAATAQPNAKLPGWGLSINLEINGKHINLPIPSDLNGKDLVRFIEKLKH